MRGSVIGTRRSERMADTTPIEATRPRISKDTRLCISLASHPSNHGTRFHNHLYSELGLDYLYKAFTTTDIDAAIGGVRALGIRGCSISMPFKEACLDLVDAIDASAAVIRSVNTIVNTDGHLTAFNTDELAIEQLLDRHRVAPTEAFVVCGSGGMASAVAAALREKGFGVGTIVARNETTGRALAERYGYAWQPGPDRLRPRLVVNATPIGMTGGAAATELPLPPTVIDEAETVFDVVATPAETPLIARARAAGTRVITGTEVAALQAAEQFVLYTGVRPTRDQVEDAAAIARAHP
jgi:shikimate dehydrogenase